MDFTLHCSFLPFALKHPGLSVLIHPLVLFIRSVVSDSLWPHRLQHARLRCPSTPRVCSNSCPLNQWCHPTISSCVTAFSSCPQSSPASRSFPLSKLFTSGGQSIGASAFSISPSSEYSELISFRCNNFLFYSSLETTFHHSSTDVYSCILFSFWDQSSFPTWDETLALPNDGFDSSVLPNIP